MILCSMVVVNIVIHPNVVGGKKTGPHQQLIDIAMVVADWIDRSAHNGGVWVMAAVTIGNISEKGIVNTTHQQLAIMRVQHAFMMG